VSFFRDIEPGFARNIEPLPRGGWLVL